VVYYVFAVVLVVVMYGLWGYDMEENVDRVARGSIQGKVKKMVMTGGGANGSPNEATVTRAGPTKQGVKEPTYYLGDAAKYITDTDRARLSAMTGNNNAKEKEIANILSNYKGTLKPQDIVGQFKSSRMLSEAVSSTNDQKLVRAYLNPQKTIQPSGEQPGELNKSQTAVVRYNKKDSAKQPLAIVPAGGARPEGGEIVLVEEFSTQKGGGAKPAKRPTGESSTPTGPPSGIPLSALIGARAGAEAGAQAGAQVSVTVVTQPAAPAPAAAPTAPPATNNKAPKPANKQPEANQPQTTPTKPQQAPAQGPQKDARKDQGAEGVRQAVEAALAKKGQKDAKKQGKTQETEKSKALDKQLGEQFKRKSAGSKELNQLMEKVKQGVGQQVDRIGGILFSLLTVLGLTAAAGTAILERIGYDPAKKVIGEATKI